MPLSEVLGGRGEMLRVPNGRWRGERQGGGREDLGMGREEGVGGMGEVGGGEEGFIEEVEVVLKGEAEGGAGAFAAEGVDSAEDLGDPSPCVSRKGPSEEDLSGPALGPALGPASGEVSPDDSAVPPSPFTGTPPFNGVVGVL